MTNDPIILGILKRFKSSSGFSDDDESLFEKYVNSLILKTNQKEAYSVTGNAFSQMCVGGDGDTGIDGLLILVNDSIVCSLDDIDAIIKKQNQIEIRYIFIQSKFKENLNCGDLNSFGNGVVDFLSEKQKLPENEQLKFWLDIKNYLVSEEIVQRWGSEYPTVSVYVAYTGKWIGDANLEAARKMILDRIKGTGLYADATFDVVDSQKIIAWNDEAENRLKVTLPFVECMGLNEAENVISSNLILCTAKDFISILSDSDGNLRRSIFKDNVRDYQGDTAINQDILQTIQEKPAYFCLYNNGITIVCKKAMVVNRKISIENPQIVNGCQTCNVLFKAYKSGLKIDDVHLMIKVIATEDDNIANSVVKGTNMQNVVYDEAFETTRGFHKTLEKYFEESQGSVDESARLYYERRSNQFASIKSIPENNIVSFGSLIQTFVSVYAKAPHDGFVHQANLLPKYKDQIFVDGQSFMPYFTAAKLFVSFFRVEVTRHKEIARFKYQIMFVFACLAGGSIPCDINNKKSIESFSEKISKVIDNKTVFEKYLLKAIDFFDQIKGTWERIKNDPQGRGIKTQAFSHYLVASCASGKPLQEISEDRSDSRPSYRGRVTRIMKDRNGRFYGFIAKEGRDIFIHQTANPDFDFSRLQGKEVVYELGEKDRKFGDQQGKIISLVQ